VTDEANFGLLYMDGSGYWKACGHLTMGAVTAAIADKLVKVVEPLTEVHIDTPTGTITARAKVKNGIAKAVTIQFPQAFFFKSCIIKVHDIGEIPVDVAYCGHFFVYVKAKDIGYKVSKENLNRLINAALKIRKATNNQIAVQHPQISQVNEIEWVVITDEPSYPRAKSKTLVIGGSEHLPSYDRSPCGTGTCGLGAILYSKGELTLNEEYITESIIGTTFTGRIVKEVRVGSLKAVVPEVTGSSFVTGIDKLIVDPDDPLKFGFSIGALPSL